MGAMSQMLIMIGSGSAGPGSPSWAFEWYAENEGLSNGASVTQLTDTSGNADHATQGTAGKRGTYTTAGLGGKAYVNFDGTDDTYNFTSDIAASSSFTIYVVWYAVATSPGSEHDACLVGKGTTNGICYQMNNHPFSPNMSPLLASGSAYANSGQVLLPRGVWHQTNVSFEEGTDSWSFRADKVAGNSGSNARAAWDGIAHVGTQNGGTNRPWLGRIAAILIATEAHDLTTKQSVENDLSTFFGGAV
jgi:hypothetical protein